MVELEKNNYICIDNITKKMYYSVKKLHLYLKKCKKITIL